MKQSGYFFKTLSVCAIAALTLLITSTAGALTVGSAAPNFQVTDADGKVQSLADYKGKYLVLEWHNQGCPYVKKHYDSGNMQKVQKEVTRQNIAWLTVISSAEGKQGYVTAAEAKAYAQQKGAAPTAILLDTTGKMGKDYGAKTTPHMFVINPEGKVIYNGAIDSDDSTDSAAIAKSSNYVKAALNEALGGKPVTVATTRPYGCSVKYAE